MKRIEDTKSPDVVGLIIQAETVGFDTVEEALIFVKAVVEASVSSALPFHMGHDARRLYKEHQLDQRHWKK